MCLTNRVTEHSTETAMTNIAVRKDNESKGALATNEPRWEPFRAMRELMNWDPFQEMLPSVNRAFTGFAPSFEVKETKDAYEFKADVPGVKEADLEVTTTGNRLTIAGKREREKQEHTDAYYTYERSYGSFSRSFTLPDGVDMAHIGADLKDGVLTVSIKKKPEAQPKKITVQSAARKS